MPLNEPTTIAVRRGDTRLEAGDHLFVFGQQGDRAFLELLFGHRQEDGT